MHDIVPIMEEDCVYPVDPDEVDIYTKKNSFLQSILEYSLAKGTSLSRVTKYSKSGDGRSSWLELKIGLKDKTP